MTSWVDIGILNEFTRIEFWAQPRELARITPEGTIEVSAILDINSLRTVAMWAGHPEMWVVA